jgi:hypothetical protein
VKLGNSVGPETGDCKSKVRVNSSSDGQLSSKSFVRLDGSLDHSRDVSSHQVLSRRSLLLQYHPLLPDGMVMFLIPSKWDAISFISIDLIQLGFHII